MAKKTPVKAAAAPQTNTPFTQQVMSQVSDPHVRLAMLTGAALEGGSYGPGSAIKAGDSGHSHGYFQINLPFHPTMTAASAEDPAKSVAYMKGAYAAAAAKVPASLWASDPERAAEQTAYKAERPAKDYYVARGQSAVDRAYNMAQGALGGSGSAPAASPSAGPAPKADAKAPATKATPQTPKAGKKDDGGALWGAPRALGGAIEAGVDGMGNAVKSTEDVATSAMAAPQAIGKAFSTLYSVSFWIRVAFILVGVALVVVGTKALLSGSAPIVPQVNTGGSAPPAKPVAAKKAPAKKSFGKVAESDAGEAAAVA